MVDQINASKSNQPLDVYRHIGDEVLIFLKNFLVVTSIGSFKRLNRST